MTRTILCAALVLLLPAGAFAQDTPPDTRRAWLVIGTASATVRGACQNCENETPFRHGASVLGNAGVRVTDRMDVGAEVFWVPIETEHGRLRTTHFDAVAQFRPWTSHGFFIKGGAGMAFVRNWVDSFAPDAINSKALSVVIGGGWHFRPAARVGLQLFASQHAAALGDLQLADEHVPDIIGNFWSVGAAIVIR